jgi:hypothetical protein
MFAGGTTIPMSFRFEPRVRLLEEEISLDDCHQNKHQSDQVRKEVRVFAEQSVWENTEG